MEYKCKMTFLMNIRKQNLHNDKQDKHPNFSWPHDMMEGEGTSHERLKILTQILAV